MKVPVDPAATPIVLVGDPADTMALAFEMARGAKGSIAVDPASNPLRDSWRHPGDELVSVDFVVDLQDVMARLRSQKAEAMAFPAAVSALVGRRVEEVERELVLQTLEHCEGNRTSAAAMLGISVRTMRNKLRAFLAEDDLDADRALQH
ncbi:DNA-binding protein [Novosphingobium sp. YJ-S2-02]|uniref:DNA-binding protein n=1 Tax=Novosphingobium aureum TaxID=2792964 RepID=A0A931MJX4_9SPHN|nr:helix-turn-helix domain-containing protein [Novosphingobium aureum]MBH0111940.1 DNA-binding protein [Novosphingobium aureum]